MKIIMEKRKPGIYAQWFHIVGYNQNGQLTNFLIYPNQAKNYAQAVRFWQEHWGETCKALYLMNADPFDESICLAA